MTAKNFPADIRLSTVKTAIGGIGRKIRTISAPVIAANHKASVMKW